jgi:hypothetical protein
MDYTKVIIGGATVGIAYIIKKNTDKLSDYALTAYTNAKQLFNDLRPTTNTTQPEIQTHYNILFNNELSFQDMRCVENVSFKIDGQYLEDMDDNLDNKHISDLLYSSINKLKIPTDMPSETGNITIRGKVYIDRLEELYKNALNKQSFAIVGDSKNNSSDDNDDSNDDDDDDDDDNSMNYFFDFKKIDVVVTFYDPIIISRDENARILIDDSESELIINYDKNLNLRYI